MSPQPLKASGRRDPTPGSDDRPLRTLPAEGRGAGWSQPSAANCYQLPELDRAEDGSRAAVDLDGKRPTFQFRSVRSRSATSDSATPWTVALQAPLSTGFSRQERWSGLPFPSLGDLPNPGIKSGPLVSLILAGGFFTTGATWEAPPLPKLSAPLCWQEEPPPRLESGSCAATVGSQKRWLMFQYWWSRDPSLALH